MNIRCEVVTERKGKYFYEISDKSGIIEISPMFHMNSM